MNHVAIDPGGKESQIAAGHQVRVVPGTLVRLLGWAPAGSRTTSAMRSS